MEAGTRVIQTFDYTAGEEYVIYGPECGELWIQARQVEMDFTV